MGSYDASSGCKKILRVSSAFETFRLDNPWWLMGPLLIGSLAWVGLEIAVNDYLNQATQTHSRATLLSMNNFIRSLCAFLTIIFYGFITRSASASQGYFVLGIILTLVLTFPLIQLFRHSRF